MCRTHYDIYIFEIYDFQNIETASSVQNNMSGLLFLKKEIAFVFFENNSINEICGQYLSMQ